VQDTIDISSNGCGNGKRKGGGGSDLTRYLSITSKVAREEVVADFHVASRAVKPQSCICALQSLSGDALAASSPATTTVPAARSSYRSGVK
jgi:hypothetical protein